MSSLYLEVIFTACLASAFTATAFAYELSPGQKLFVQHCVDCHGSETAEAEVRLDNLSKLSREDSAKTWQKVMAVLEDSLMPPDDTSELSSNDRKLMIDHANQMLDLELSQINEVPQTPIRRMNRFQYNNSVKDLLDLKVDLFALPEMIVRDHSDYFDPNSGTMPGKLKVGNRPLGKSQLVQPRLAGVAPFPQDLRLEHGGF